MLLGEVLENKPSLLTRLCLHKGSNMNPIARKLVFCLLPLFFNPYGWSASSYHCYELAGAKIIASDGAYLGTLSEKYSSDSIYNEHGVHGSKYSSNSIWNTHSDYGNEYSRQSAFNNHATNPPVLLKSGKVVGKVTIDPYAYGGTNPLTIGEECGWAD
jgi:hypothetical protein